MYLCGGEIDAGEFSVSITSESLDPVRLAEQLGMQPTKSHRGGDTFGKAGRTYNYGEWCFSTGRLDFRSAGPSCGSSRGPHHRFMQADTNEIKKRETAARAAIRKAFDPSDGESAVAMFVSHHLEELDSAYWQKHFSTAKPDPQRIIDSLVLRSHWGGDDELETFDFTLPDDATNYLISVSFDDDGEVADITMES